MQTRLPYVLEADSLDELFSYVLEGLVKRPQHVCSPRGSKIKETLVTTVVLNDPRSRLLTCDARGMNYGFGVGEFLWYWNGRRDLATMLYYNRRMSAFSDDGQTLNSAYGYRLRKKPIYTTSPDSPGLASSQWDTVVKTLLEDPDSRRAVMTINLPEDERQAVVNGSKDVPCTLSLQFFVRDGKLDLSVHMRSNDVIWGLPYDVFSFTLMQECMALDLQRHDPFKSLTLGKYYHTVGSVHLYERHFGMAEEILGEYSSKKQADDLNWARKIGCPTMEPLLDLKELDRLSRDEELLRKNEIAAVETATYGGCLSWMAGMLNDHRKKRDQEGLKP